MVRWNPEKDRFLRTARGVSFQQIADEIVSGNYLDILENPGRSDQQIFLVRIAAYTWVVPFVIEEDETIFLKTAYQSRKFRRLYGGLDEKEDRP
jgi:transcriptional regulator with XRE-family HTH domain